MSDDLSVLEEFDKAPDYDLDDLIFSDLDDILDWKDFPPVTEEDLDASKSLISEQEEESVKRLNDERRAAAAAAASSLSPAPAAAASSLSPAPAAAASSSAASASSAAAAASSPANEVVRMRKLPTNEMRAALRRGEIRMPMTAPQQFLAPAGASAPPVAAASSLSAAAAAQPQSPLSSHSSGARSVTKAATAAAISAAAFEEVEVDQSPPIRSRAVSVPAAASSPVQSAEIPRRARSASATRARGRESLYAQPFLLPSDRALRAAGRAGRSASADSVPIGSDRASRSSIRSAYRSAEPGSDRASSAASSAASRRTSSSPSSRSRASSSSNRAILKLTRDQLLRIVSAAWEKHEDVKDMVRNIDD